MQNLSFYAPTGAYTFITKTLPCFTEIAIAFYPLNSARKILPLNIANLLTPVGLGAWFGDDGNTRLTSGGVHISTESFTKEECAILCDIFWNKWGI